MTALATLARAPLIWALSLALALGMGALVWKTHFSSDIAYLPDHGEAQWILYPAPIRLGVRRSAPFVTRFYRTFQVESVPTEALLHVRALRSAQVWLNGHKLNEAAVTPDAWKQGTTLDIAPQLQRGDNVLIVEVENAMGPPILWLALSIGNQQIISDGDWSASLAGAQWLPARPADSSAAMPRVVPLEEARRHPTSVTTVDDAISRAHDLVPSLVRQFRLPVEEQSTVAALRMSWQRLALWGVAAICLLSFGTILATSMRARISWARTYGLWLLLGLCAGCWLIGIENNAPSLTNEMGFDAQSHHEYVAYVQENWRLPLADEGWETFQPPLYYVAAATLLGVVGDSTQTSTGEIWLRRLSLALGLMTLACSAVAMRLIFPQHPRRQVLGLVFAACLPVHLYVFHHITNDPAAAAFGSLALCATLAVIRRPVIDGRTATLLGAALGLALLAKATGLALVISALVALAYRLWSDDSVPYRRRIGLLGSAMTACATLAALHYGRTWWHFGTPLVGNWDPRIGSPWWSDPGYRTAADYVPSGDVLLHPLYRGASNLWSTLYSTMWGDGFCSSMDGLLQRPPWNYPAMLAGYALAFIPLAGLMVGAVGLAHSAWQKLTPQQLLLIGAPGLTVAAMFWMTLSVPGFGQTKAVYLVPIAICLSALAGWGWDLIAGHGRWQSCLVVGVIGVWGANSLYAFWVPRQSIAARTTQAFYLGNSDAVRASAEFRAVLLEAPDSVEARAGLGLQLLRLGRSAEAQQELQLALAHDPGFAEAYWWLATTYQHTGQIDRAIELARAALMVAPDAPVFAEYLGVLLTKQSQDLEAELALTDALRVATDGFSIHYLLSELYARQGDFHRSFEHARYATYLRPTDAAAQDRLAQSATVLNRDTDVLVACRAALEARPDSPATNTLLAWVLATSADDTLRDPVEAIRLARVADRATGGQDPEPLDALAAALAAIGNYEKAASTATAAIARAKSNDRLDLIGPLAARRALYEQSQAYRRPAYEETPPTANLRKPSLPQR